MRFGIVAVKNSDVVLWAQAERQSFVCAERALENAVRILDFNAESMFILFGQEMVFCIR